MKCQAGRITSLESRLLGGKLKEKIAGRNIDNLKYADNTTLMAENEEEL